MTTEIVEWISDISDPDARGNRYVNIYLEGNESAYIGKQNYDDILYIQGILIEGKGKPIEMTLEDTGRKNKKGMTHYKIKAVGEYQPTPYQGGGSPSPQSPSSGGSVRSRPPDSPDRDEDIRWAVALKAAANANPGKPADVLLDYALVLYNFDFRSVAQPPRATDDGGVEPDLPGSAPTTSAPEAHSDSLPSTSPSTGADSSAAESLASPAAEDRGGPGQGLDGEAGPCPPHSYPRGAKGNAPCKKCGQWGDAG